MTTNAIRQQLHEQIDRVPVEILRQIADFVAFITNSTSKSEEAPTEQARFESFVGVLEGVITTDELMMITRGEELSFVDISIEQNRVQDIESLTDKPDFFALAGIWKDREVSLKTIRQQGYRTDFEAWLTAVPSADPAEDDRL